jgi:uncharacterized protein
MRDPTRRLPCLGRHGLATRWAVLIVVTAVFAGGLLLLRLPAGLLLGALAAGAVIALADGSVRVPLTLMLPAQAVVGCLISRSVSVPLLAEMVRDWPLFTATVLVVVVVSTALGWLLARLQVLPGTTAVWGASPGAATAMVLLAEAYGADIRLVAVMQYLRVVLVTVVASAVAHLWAAGGDTAAPVAFFGPVDWIAFGKTALLIATATTVAWFIRLPAGPMLLGMVGGVVLQIMGWLTVELPPWLLAVSYAAIGWSIGLRFNRPILIHAGRALPRLFASTLVLILVCGGFAALLVEFAGLDPLTAYLATSPGGADSVAIIAATSNVDVPFVMAMQMARFLFVTATGPGIARFVAKHVGAGALREADLDDPKSDKHGAD